MALLELKNVSKRFGGLQAVLNVDLAVESGEIVGLIGPNGSGKSTLFNLITGFLRPDGGEILFNGDNLIGKAPSQIANRGITRIFQGVSLFKESTVLENLLIAFQPHSKVSFWGSLFETPFARREKAETEQRAREMLGFVGLLGVESRLATSIPFGHQRRLAVAIALATNPQLLLLDEPLTGMNPRECGQMLDLVTELLEMGKTIVLVEHHVRIVTNICKRMIVLNFGAKIAEGTPVEVIKNRKVIEAYLGTR